MNLIIATPPRFVVPSLNLLIVAAISLSLVATGHAAAEAGNRPSSQVVHPADDDLTADAGLEQLARQAVSVDAESAAAAIHQLRAAGPAALQALLQTHRQDLQSLWIPTSIPTGEPPTGERSSAGTSLPASTASERLRHAIEQVAAQRDAHASGLFWYTDLAEAKRAAATSQRPILSLRLLGRLDEEMSCANSRLFRTTLYCDPAISERLREHFVLHWESVRPVPRITIDFGDGRKLEQTVTGNSVHYLLSTDGTPLDALPGLYSPAEFTEWLDQGYELSEWLNTHWNYPEGRAAGLRAYHRQRQEVVPAGNPEMMWRSWLGANGHPVEEVDAELEATAARAAALTVSKSIMEVRPLREVGIVTPPADSFATVLERDSERRRAELTLSPEARALILAKQGADQDPDRFATMIDNLERSIAGDTALNELVLRPRLRQWFIEDRIPGDLGELTEMLYAELFLTPLDDPWMGMANVEFWPALDHGGMTIPSGPPQQSTQHSMPEAIHLPASE